MRSTWGPLVSCVEPVRLRYMPDRSLKENASVKLDSGMLLTKRAELRLVLVCHKTFHGFADCFLV